MAFTKINTRWTNGLCMKSEIRDIFLKIQEKYMGIQPLEAWGSSKHNSNAISCKESG